MQHIPWMKTIFSADWRSEGDGSGFEWQIQEASPKKSAHVSWRNASRLARLQTQGVHGLKGKPEAGEEGGEGGGEFNVVLFILF